MSFKQLHNFCEERKDIIDDNILILHKTIDFITNNKRFHSIHTIKRCVIIFLMCLF